MSVSFKEYRRNAFTAIRELLVCADKTTLTLYMIKAKRCTTETELSRVLAEVRKIL